MKFYDCQLSSTIEFQKRHNFGMILAWTHFRNILTKLTILDSYLKCFKIHSSTRFLHDHEKKKKNLAITSHKPLSFRHWKITQYIFLKLETHSFKTHSLSAITLQVGIF